MVGLKPKGQVSKDASLLAFCTWISHTWLLPRLHVGKNADITWICKQKYKTFPYYILYFHFELVIMYFHVRKIWCFRMIFAKILFAAFKITASCWSCFCFCSPVNTVAFVNIYVYSVSVGVLETFLWGKTLYYD